MGVYDDGIVQAKTAAKTKNVYLYFYLSSLFCIKQFKSFVIPAYKFCKFCTSSGCDYLST